MKIINMNTTQIEKLIDLVSCYPQLYDYNNIEYADQHKRDLIWEIIGKELNLTPELCRAKWTILRSGYRKALRCGKAYSRKKWRFEDNMDFLKNCIQNKRSCRRFEVRNNSECNNVSEDDEETVILDMKAEPEDPKLEECSQEDDRTSSCDSVRYSQLKVDREREKLPDCRDSLSKFFMSMAGTVKMLPPLMQAQIKADVFRCVSDAEIKYLELQEGRN